MKAFRSPSPVRERSDPNTCVFVVNSFIQTLRKRTSTRLLYRLDVRLASVVLASALALALEALAARSLRPRRPTRLHRLASLTAETTASPPRNPQAQHVQLLVGRSRSLATRPRHPLQRHPRPRPPRNHPSRLFETRLRAGAARPPTCLLCRRWITAAIPLSRTRSTDQTPLSLMSLRPLDVRRTV